MDEENTTSRPDSSRRRLKIAGIATVALLAVPGGAVISNAFAADGGSAATTPAQPTQSQGPAQTQDSAPQGQGDGDGQGPRGDHGDCPGKGGEGQGGSGGSGSGSGESGSTGTADTAYTLQ
jgi:hypothetical protein